jgi:hypothetical protein
MGPERPKSGSACQGEAPRLTRPFLASKVAKVANFCTLGFGDLAGQKLVSKVANSFGLTQRPYAEMSPKSLLELKMNSPLPRSNSNFLSPRDLRRKMPEFRPPIL